MLTQSRTRLRKDIARRIFQDNTWDFSESSFSSHFARKTSGSRLFAERTLKALRFRSASGFRWHARAGGRKSTKGWPPRPTGPVKRASSVGRVMSPMKCEKRIGHERDPYLVRATSTRPMGENKRLVVERGECVSATPRLRRFVNRPRCRGLDRLSPNFLCEREGGEIRTTRSVSCLSGRKGRNIFLITNLMNEQIASARRF